MSMQRLAITWLGHSTFLIRTPGGRRVLLDPWLRSNPACPEAFKKPPRTDLILVSHGHADHMDDAVLCARESGAPVVAAFELCDWLGRKGLQNLAPMNKGGSIEIAGLRVTMTDARLSSGYVDNGEMIFGDMRLIGEMYQPSIAFLPIGDRFTMGPGDAARACALLGVRQVVPMHWGTFALLTGTPAELKALVPAGVEVLELKPGETAE